MATRFILLLFLTLASTLFAYAQKDTTGAALNHEAMTLFKQGEYVRAILIAEKAVKQTEKEFGNQHLNYAITLDNLAGLYRTMGQYAKAVPLLEECLVIKEKVLGKLASSYAATLSSLAKTYELMGQYAKSLRLFEVDLKNTEISKGKTHPEYGSALVNLAGIYQSIGQYENADPLLHKSLIIYENSLGKKHTYYGITLSNLADLYRYRGQYDKALPLLQECLKIFGESADSRNQPEYIYALTNLATYYEDIAEYQKAIAFYEQSLNILEKIQGKTHPDYANTLIGLANVYKDLRQYKKALQLYEESRAIREQVLGKTHPDYATILNNLAVLYGEIGEYDRAQDLIKECLSIQKNILPENHPHYARTLGNLGRLELEMGHYQQALILLQTCLMIREKVLGKTHPLYANTLSNIGFVYENRNQPQKARPLFQESYAIYQQQLLQILGFTGRNQQANYLGAKNENFTFGYSFALDHHRQQPDLAGWAYNNALFHNGLLLNAGQSLYRAIEQSSDTTIRQLFGELKIVKASLAALYSRPVAERNGLEDLEKQSETLEQELTRRSQTFRDIRSNLLIKWPQVQKGLKSHEAAIEFISFRHYNKKWTDSTLYAAFVIRPGYVQPKLVRLFEQHQLGGLLADSSSHSPTKINTLYRGGKTGKSGNEAFGNRGRALSRLIWQPLDSLLAGVQTIYLAPAGQLHQLAFAALPHPTDTAKLISQRYELRQLGSTRLVAQSQSQTDTSLRKPLTAELYGGIQYSIDSLQLAQRALPQTEIKSPLATREATRSGEWIYLPGTQQEIDSLRRILPQQGVGQHSGADATEERVKGLSGHSPTVLHVATHGFFFPNLSQQPKDHLEEGANRFEHSENPLLRSGLVLAGANHVWKGGRPIPGLQDGILNALEVAEINLSATQLVVLSACETGLGQVNESEGVFGLQRSFKLAGAKYLLMSLWKVPDAETAQYMIHFYRQLVTGVSFRSAYRSTQAYMLSQYPQEPYKWAAFVLVE